MSKKIKVSIVIVFYSGIGRLLECLTSITKSKIKTGYEVIVVNNSTKKHLSRTLNRTFKSIHLTTSPGNIGYGAGNNLGVKQAVGEYIFILNPDTLLLPKTVDNLVSLLDSKKKAALVAPNLVDKTGNVYSQLGRRELTPLRAIFSQSFLAKLLPRNKISEDYWSFRSDTERPLEVEVVPGSAFMIRKIVFESVGGFDENMFLFFEENDLCKRLQKVGYKLFIEPKSRVVHFWRGKNSKSKILQSAFKTSRFYYFRKHYGLPKALCVELFTRFSKWDALFVGVLIIGLFLRFYRLAEAFSLDAEVGDNLLDIKNYYISRRLPLVGPPTSHPWLSFPPFFYWLYGPVLVISKFNPLSHAYFGAFINSLILPANYLLVRKLWTAKAAILTTLLIAISPFFILFSQTARFYTYVGFLIYPFLYLVTQLVAKKRFLLLWIFIIIGLMLSFHYTPIVFIPPVLYLSFSYLKNISMRDGRYILIGFLLPLTTFIINDAKNGFVMISKLLLWLPYRLFGFFGILTISGGGGFNIVSSLQSLIDFIGLLFVPRGYDVLKILIIALFGLLFFDYFRRVLRGLSNNINRVLLTLFVFSLVLLFVHGNPPLHYYLVISPFPFLFFADWLMRTRSSLIVRLCTYLLLAVLFVGSVVSVVQSRNGISFSHKSLAAKNVPYEDQLAVSSFIYSDSVGFPYALYRVGENDEFDGDFAQNYQYLLWLMGNEPVSVGKQVINALDRPILKYTIYENTSALQKADNDIVWIGDVAVRKEIVK